MARTLRLSSLSPAMAILIDNETNEAVLTVQRKQQPPYPTFAGQTGIIGFGAGWIYTVGGSMVDMGDVADGVRKFNEASASDCHLLLTAEFLRNMN